MKCPFGNERCLCQTCQKSMLNTETPHCIDCYECDKEKEQRHDIYLCTGHKKVEENDGQKD